MLIFQDNREKEKAEEDETEANNQKTIAYLWKILAGVFDSNDNEDNEFHHHHNNQDNSVSQAQDYHLTQEYDVDPDPDVKGDLLNVFIF